ncbi:hypothetical protein BT69DRAFT_1233008 [Atractiella rhizophila]|nr:hypothetical protein BT69DRAFT_1233008 [Atractiella rhizophila]
MSTAQQRDFLASLPSSLDNIFSATQTQSTSKPSKRLLITLSKTFKQSCAITTVPDGGNENKRVSLTGERGFREALQGLLDRTLDKKRGHSGAERVVRFCVEWVEWEGKQSASSRLFSSEEEGKENLQQPLQRLVSALFRHYCKGFKAKDKTVRFRCVQIVAALLSKIQELDEEDHSLLLPHLSARLQDKEPAVRGQAVLGLARLQEELDDDEGFGESTEGEDEEEEEEVSASRLLARTMKYDPSAEVRRLALLNLSLSAATLPPLLSRQRDMDPLTRKALYRIVLKEIGIVSLGRQREGAIEKGLKDREENVKKAAKEWVCASLPIIVAGEGNGTEELLKVLKEMDVITSTMAKDVLECLFEGRPELMDEVAFDDAYWNTLTPESAFLVRVYLLWLQKQNDEAKLSVHMPEITPLSQLIQSKFTQLGNLVEAIESKDPETLEQEAEDEDVQSLIRLAFVERELLAIAVKEDYADEIGRRAMFALIRDMISNPLLPQDLLPPALDVLCKISANEQDFMRVVVEIVQSLRDDEEDFDDSKDADAMREDDDDDEDGGAQRRDQARKVKKNFEVPTEGDRLDIHIRCLGIFRAMLERTLQDNTSLQGLLHELVIPSVKSKEPAVRYEGLMCLGLICLLDKKTAIDAFGLFTHQSQNAEGDLRIKVLQTIFDILMLHGLNFLSEKGHSPDRVIDFLLHSLDQSDPEAQATSGVGISKLMLSGMIADDEVLKSLVLMYFSPETAGNQPLRQCLSYFFPVYCFSSAAHQRRMQKVFMPSLDILNGVYEDLGDEERQDMIPPPQIAAQMVDWTDPRRAVTLENLDQPTDELVHYDLCLDIIKQIYKESKKEQRKLFCQLLSRLWLPDQLDEWKAKGMAIWISDLKDRRPLADAVSKNAINKFEKNLKDKYPKELAGLDDDDLHVAEAWIEIQAEIEQLRQLAQEKDATVVSKKAK